MLSRIAIAALGLTAATTLAAQPADNYVDPALCAACHADKAASFAKTGMAGSFYRLQPKTAIEKFGKPYYHAPSDTYLEMIERGGRYFQRRWQIGFDGKETNVDEKQVDYVIGSGNHVRTYVHRTDHNTLQQLPLSWYSEKDGYWAMSPGYDRPDYMGSTRVINNPCMFCHNAYPKIPKSAEEADAVPQFLDPLPEGIDCQRCHGPGQQHVESGGKAAIVNPKKLSPDRELEVCMQCHLQTTALSLPHSIQKMNTGPFSYTPALPMDTFRLTFSRADGEGTRFEIAHTAYRLRESQCFLRSGGDSRLRCTTCHDPHTTAATVGYNAVCQNCHATAHNQNADCVSCHMPKRRTDDVVHAVMTDHLIQRRPPPGDLLADKAEIQESAATAYRGEVVPYYPANPDPLYAALAQVRDGANLENGIPRLASLLEQQKPPEAGFYTALGNAYRSAGQLPKAIPWFEQAVQHAPESTIVQRNLGSAQMEMGQLASAEATLRRVTSLVPTDSQGWGLLGEVLLMQRKSEEGKTAFAKAIALDPEDSDIRNSLATFLIKDGDAASAEKEIREAIRIRPGSASARANLAGLLASRGQTDEARYEFKQSILLNPASADTRLNYGRLLASVGDVAEAQTQAEASIAADSNLAGAHELLGSLLGTKGDLDSAIRELQTAVRLQPDSGRAQFALGVALGRNRDRAGAIEHLKLAAASADPQARAEALDLLQRLGQ